MPKKDVSLATVTKKIQEANQINGYGVEMVVAIQRAFTEQKKNIKQLDARIEQMERNNATFYSDINSKFSDLQASIDETKTSVDKYHADAIKLSVWQQVFHSLFATWTGRIIIVISIGAIALAGQRILEILKLVPMGG